MNLSATEKDFRKLASDVQYDVACGLNYEDPQDFEEVAGYISDLANIIRLFKDHKLYYIDICDFALCYEELFCLDNIDYDRIRKIAKDPKLSQDFVTLVKSIPDVLGSDLSKKRAKYFNSLTDEQILNGDFSIHYVGAVILETNLYVYGWLGYPFSALHEYECEKWDRGRTYYAHHGFRF